MIAANQRAAFLALLLAAAFHGGAIAEANDLGTPTAVAIDANGVEEPTTIALRKFGVTHQVTAFIRRLSVPPAVFRVRDEWSYRASSGGAGAGQFAIPAGYTDSSDPVMATGGARGAETVYAVGRVMNRDATNNNSTNPASIRVWQSADGGASFPGTGSQVDMMPAGAPRTVDKPWIAVSPEGIVYTAWVRFDLTGGGQSQIMFRRSRNGVAKAHICCGRPAVWDEIVTVSAPGDVTGPQIVVDAARFVYVIWTDFGARQLRIARSLHPAAAFEPDGVTAFDAGGTQTIAPFNRIGSGLGTNRIAGGIRVLPLASAQYNAVTDEIVIAWSEGESDESAHTDVRLVHGAAGATMTFSPVSLNYVNLLNADQFTPAIGVDEGGNLLLAYYDRSNATTDYQETAIELTPTGSFIARSVLGPACAAAIVGEYQSLSRGPSATSARWQLAWACSSFAVPADRRVIYQTVEPLPEITSAW